MSRSLLASLARRSAVAGVAVALALPLGSARGADEGDVARTAGAAAVSARGAHGAVATDQMLGTETGLRVLRAGGNAVDAAVAIGYTLAVTYPAAGNLGGGGFLLLRTASGVTHFVDFRETAPAAASAGMYLDANGAVVPNASVDGPRAAAVPGSVAGLEYARATYGTRSRHELLRDAIGYAEDGFVLRDADAARIAHAAARLRVYPASAALYLPHGTPLAAGTRLRQPDLARTLRRIDRLGPAGFYEGPIARALANAVRAGGGIVTTADLAAYRAVDRAPLTCSYHGVTIVTAPLPSSGGVTMCETLGILGEGPPAPSVRSFENVHREAEAERRAFADRNTALGDPAFLGTSPVPRLLNPASLAKLRASIDPERATPSSTIHAGDVTHEGTNTTNYSVVDAAGDAVDVTYTLNDTFGSAFLAGSTGVMMNDEMDDFTAKPGVPNLFGLVQGATNAIAPGKRPLSSMTPSIVVTSSGQPLLVTGAAGGPRIITSTMDAIRAVVDFHEPADVALADPRVHSQWLPDVLYAEPGAFDAATLARLIAAGYTVEFGPAASGMNAAGVLPDGTRLGAHDPRVPTGDALAY